MLNYQENKQILEKETMIKIFFIIVCLLIAFHFIFYPYLMQSIPLSASEIRKLDKPLLELSLEYRKNRVKYEIIEETSYKPAQKSLIWLDVMNAEYEMKERNRQIKKEEFQKAQESIIEQKLDK